jgi:hypothetical protein
MDVNLLNRSVKLNKELNKLDVFVIDFTEILNSLSINYVIVSGYVSILFGRNRASEDINIIIEKIDKTLFLELWSKLVIKFECLNTSNLNSAYNDYLNKDSSIRFSYKNKFIPNMEIKFNKDDFDLYSLKEKIEITLNNKTFYISPIEIQIMYKLFLGSEKDIEDGRFLFKRFEKHLNKSKLLYFKRKLNIDSKFIRFLK